MIQYKIFPRNLSGSVILPGDKSISQRVSILCGIADGQSHISGFSYTFSAFKDNKKTLHVVTYFLVKSDNYSYALVDTLSLLADVL